MDATTQRPKNLIGSAPAAGTSFYAQLRDRMMESLLQSGQPGDRLPSEKQLAKQFDASTLTISRILHEFQEAGLLQRVPGKGTFLRHLPGTPGEEIDEISPVQGYAGGLLPREDFVSFHGAGPVGTGGRVLRHTCIIADFSKEPEVLASQRWPHRVVSTVERRLQQQGARTTLLNRWDVRDDDIGASLDQALGHGVDSVLYLQGGSMLPWGVAREQRWARELSKAREAAQGLTIAQVAFSGRPTLPFDCVSFDGLRGSFLATRHLTKLGHREICFLGRLLTTDWVKERLDGFWDALDLEGLVKPGERANGGGRVFTTPEPTGELDEDDWAWAARQVARQFFDNKEATDRFTAVVAVNDTMAVAFLEEAARRGIEVPGQISVIGFDDRFQSKTMGLSTIHPPIEEIGESAVALLIQRHKEPFESGKIHISLNPSLLLRASTAPPS